MSQAEAIGAQDQPMPLAEERDLIRRCQEGDVEAFNVIIGASQDAVFGLAYRLMGDYDAANDLAQETFLAFYRKIGQFRGDSRVKTWLYRIVVNLAKNAWKKRGRRKESAAVSLDDPQSGLEGEGQAFDPPSGAPSPRDRAAAREEAAILQECLERLSPEHREALTLRCMEGLSYEEIAEAAECTLGTVKSRINRARAELRQMMAERM